MTLSTRPAPASSASKPPPRPRSFAAAALDAEEKKLASGKSTNFEVLSLQRDLTTARNAEIRALVDYNKALAQLAFAEGTLLERRGITVTAK